MSGTCTETRQTLSKELMASALRNLLNASMKTQSDLLIVAIMLLTIIAVEPLISALVVTVLGGSALIIFTRVRRLLD